MCRYCAKYFSSITHINLHQKINIIKYCHWTDEEMDSKAWICSQCFYCLSPKMNQKLIYVTIEPAPLWPYSVSKILNCFPEIIDQNCMPNSSAEKKILTSNNTQNHCFTPNRAKGLGHDYD